MFINSLSQPCILLSLLIFISLIGCDSDHGHGEVSARQSEISYPVTTGPISSAHFGTFSLTGLVEGLEYKTQTITGVTDEFGGYHYLPGEEIEFSVGGTILGKVLAKPLISPMDLVDGAKLPSTQYEAKGYVDTYLYSASGYINNDTRMLDRVVNISSFLISLDSDKKTDNGIKVHAGSLAELKNVGFDLNIQGRYFESNAYYSTVLHQLYNKGFLESATAVKSLLALDLYIQSQLPLAPLFILAEFQKADDNDELKPEWIHLFDSKSYLTSTTYWSKGSTNRYYIYEYSHNGDFTYLYESTGLSYEKINKYQYNKHGKRTVREECGKSCFKYVAQYDGSGHQVGLTQDTDRDGNIDRVNTMKYDSRGNLLLEIRDYDNDGEINDRLHYKYDTKDRVIYFERDDGKNIVNYNVKRWDENSRLISLAKYSGNSEFPYQVFEITSTEEGEVSTTSFDNNNDGEFEDISILVNNHNGQLLRKTFDKEGDGILESIRIYEYDENGNVTSLSIRSEGELYSEDRIYYYGYDELNRRISTQSDHNNDGDIDVLEEKTYGDLGYVLQVKTTDFEESVVEITNYQRNAENKATYWENRVEGEALALEFSRYSYDVFGEIILLEKDTNGDGLVDYISQFDRSATGYYINSIDKNGNGIFERISHVDQYGNYFQMFGYNDTTGEREHYSESKYKQVGYMSYFLFEAKRFN